MKMHSLEDLFIHELRDLYDVEHQIIKALPKMIKKAMSPELQSALEEHLEQTKEQAERLDEIFEMLDQKPRAIKCYGIRGILDEGKELLSEDAEPAVKDAGMIAAAQKVEHYEISGYGSARTWAQMLGHEKAAHLLQLSLDEEKAADQRLNEIAEHIVNQQAAVAAHE
jgi:ferritin-like metal-binding protein YciE